jgi:hypothetical protein
MTLSCSPAPAYWITASAWKMSSGGIVIPRAWAVLRLMTNSNFMGCSTGRSAGCAPRVRSGFVGLWAEGRGAWEGGRGLKGRGLGRLRGPQRAASLWPQHDGLRSAMPRPHARQPRPGTLEDAHINKAAPLAGPPPGPRRHRLGLEPRANGRAARRCGARVRGAPVGWREMRDRLDVPWWGPGGESPPRQGLAHADLPLRVTIFDLKVDLQEIADGKVRGALARQCCHLIAACR